MVSGKAVMKRFCFALLLSIPLITACSRDNHDHPELTTGKQLFDHHCAECHGPDGKGLFLKGAPANMPTKLSSYQIIHKLKSGEEGNSRMPVFDNMSDTEARRITTYLKSRR